jgi:hypothetical protein
MTGLDPVILSSFQKEDARGKRGHDESNEKRLSKLSVTSVLHGLVGRPRMVFAVGRLIARGVAAEAEIFRTWIADGPFAGLVGEVKDGDAAALGQVH